MADANTTLYGMVKPEVGASADTWGTKLNTDMDDVDALLGSFVLTGSSSAYVLTTGLSLTTYAPKQRFKVQWNHTNASATPTITVDGISSKSIKKRDGSTNPSANDLVSGRWNEILYDGTNVVVTDLLPSDFQPLDATLTALAALSWGSGSPVVQFTAADTVSLTLTPSVTDITTSGQVKIASGSAAAPGIIFSSATTTGLAYNLSAASSVSIVNATTEAARFGSTRALFLAGTVGSPNGFLTDTDNGWYYIGTNNWGLSAGGSKIVDIATTGIEITGTLRGRPPASTETTGTLTSASSNKTIQATGGITIDGNVHTAGDFIFIYAGSASRTITQGTTGTPTQRLHGSATTGNLTLSARGCACVFFISATEWVISGDVA